MKFVFSLSVMAALFLMTGTAAAGKNRCANGQCGVVQTATVYVVPAPVAPAPSVAAGNCNASAVTAGCSASASKGCSEGRGFFKRFKKKNRGCGG